MPDREKIIPILSLPLAALVIVTSISGLLTPDFYSKETPAWAAQSFGQDIVDLFFVVPVLIITTILGSKKNETAISLWAGTNLYLSYTFLIYCFDIHFNKLFIIYCLSLGLSVYSFIYFLTTLIRKNPANRSDKKTPLRYVGIYFIIIPVIFYFLWLSDIIPPILNNKLPKSLAGNGLPTNPVEVIDLSLILPGTFVTGILLLKGRAIGFLMTPVLLTFFVLMGITIATLTIVERSRGLGSDYSLAIIMSMLTVFNIILLIIYFAGIKNNKTFFYNCPG